MNKNLFIIFVLIIFSCTKKINVNKQSNQDSNVINSDKTHETNFQEVKYKNLNNLNMFKNFKVISGLVLDTKHNESKVLTYLKKDNLNILAIEKIISSSDLNTKHYLLDTVHYYGNKLYTDMNSCNKINDSSEENIFAFTEYENKEYFNKILKAWSIDLIKNEFKVIDSRNVKCFNISFNHEE